MKKVILLPAAMLCTVVGHSQETKPAAHKVSFGIGFGVNEAGLQTGNVDRSQISQLGTEVKSGFSLSLMAEKPLSAHFSVVGNAALTYYSCTVDIVRVDQSKVVYDVPPMVGVSAYLKYKPLKGNFQPYLLAGPGYQMPLVTESNEHLQLTKPLVSVDLGIGVERKFANFTLAPEFHICRGLNNYSNIAGVGEASLNAISIALNFKG